MVERDADWLYQLMTTTLARIYICGDELTMIKDVNATLSRCVKRVSVMLVQLVNNSLNGPKQNGYFETFGFDGGE